MKELRVPPRVADGDFAGWLRDAMAHRGMTLRMLAMRADVDHSTISRIVSDGRDPHLSTALALIKVLEGQPLTLTSSSPDARSRRAG